MLRRKLIVGMSLLVVVVAADVAQAAPSLSTSDRLKDRRYVTTGSRSYVVGAEDGRFPAAGWHIRGEMGGVWTPPLKLLDGLWFAVDGDWLGPATRFTSGSGWVAMDRPAGPGLEARQIEFAPDGKRAALIGLRLSSTRGERRVKVTVDAHSELMSAYPWGGTMPSQSVFNLSDTADVRGGRLVFRERGTPPVPNASEHDWAAVVGADRRPVGSDTGDAFRGPQDPPVVCPADGTPPPYCDESAFGKGAGGSLDYSVRVPKHGSATLWIAVAGSDRGLGDALDEHEGVLRDPDGALKHKQSNRQKIASRTRLDLPGDRLLEQGVEWSKQNLADSVQAPEDLQARFTNEGKEYPAPVGTITRARFVGAGFPDYPWLFATDGEYTAFASVAAGQFGPISDHLRALRDVSLLINGDSGKVVHEVVTDGSVYYGANSSAGNTDETAKFPSTLALVWRWTGDDRLRDQLYDFAVSNMHYVVDDLDADGDGWPEGLGNVERTGMGEEKLDNTVYTIRGLFDLADLAHSKGDAATADWAESHAQAMRTAFEPAWWMPEIPQHADSLDDPGNVKVQQRHWIGVTPMEAELLVDGEPTPGLTTSEHGRDALALRETPCFGDDFGLFHTGSSGCDGGPEGAGEKQTFSLNTAIMAVGEGNYGRLGAGQQRRFTTANRRLQLPEPDEQPGAMPEIAPSPAYGRSVDKQFVDRAMVLQAWGNYGTLWPVVHQHLGVRPDLGRGALEVTPQVPADQSRVGGENIRLGSGAVDVWASHQGASYRTKVRVGVGLRKLVVGHTLPGDASVDSVTLDGTAVEHTERSTNRGLEVLVRAPRSGTHELLVRSAG